MHGFKITIGLEMPTKRPKDVALCDECGTKHPTKEDCDSGLTTGGELPLPKLDKNTTGRELIDTGMKRK